MTGRIAGRNVSVADEIQAKPGAIGEFFSIWIRSIADGFGNQFVPGFRPAVIDALSYHAGSRRLQTLNQAGKPAVPSDDAFVLKEDIVFVSDVFEPTVVPGANVHSNVLSIKNCRSKGQTREFDWPARLLIYNDAHVESSFRIMIDDGL
jgi:hypothetical protein